jgi:hypothetical protein
MPLDQKAYKVVSSALGATTLGMMALSKVPLMLNVILLDIIMPIEKRKRNAHD